MARYIIIEKEKGIFLGHYLGLPLFSNNLLIPVTKAVSFETIEEAKDYIKHTEKFGYNFSINPIDYEKDYIPIDILIKSGYSEYTKKILKFIPVLNGTVH